jgi:hypothetical protein
MADNLIITPVGIPLIFDDRYDRENHWRYTDKAERKYETLAVVYNDYVPEPNTYDHILHMKGHKWQIIRELPKMFDFSKYKYIGCIDDDLVTTIKDFNEGFELGIKYNLPFWQLSVVEGTSYQCCAYDSECDFSETNFIEMGTPVFRNDMFFKILEFFNELDIEVGWGVDKMFCGVLQTPGYVIHSANMYHPPNNVKPSYYDQKEAMREMNYMISEVYPKIMRDKYKRDDWQFIDSQVTFRKFKIAR